MNKERRKAIDEISAKIADLLEEVNAVAAEEREAFDALSEKAQEGERGQAMSDAADNLDAAGDLLQQAQGLLEEAQT